MRGRVKTRRWGLVLPGIFSIALLTASDARGGTATFGYTGAPQPFTVPEGIIEIGIVAVGGRGGGALGGYGAVASATTPVIPGQVLYVDVAGVAAVAPVGATGPRTYGGGGAGGADGGGGGGGISAVRWAPHDDNIVVAGGGGGAGGLGGGAGGNAGQPGADGAQGTLPCDEIAHGGDAGTTTDYYGSGGAGPSAGVLVDSPGGEAGVGGSGGQGGSIPPESPDRAGGGGGGGAGRYGGGGGAAGLEAYVMDFHFASCFSAGGGGGASFFAPYTTNRSLTTDTTGVPSVTISSGESADRVPQTKIDKAPKARTTTRKPRFKFSSSEPGSTFICKLDRRGRQECESPVRYTHVKEGKHAFKVRATNAFGTPDPTPAKFKFEVVGRER